MTPPTTDTSREAVELACEHVETHERNLNNGFPMTCEIGSDIQSLISVCRAVVEERDTLVAEHDALRDQLAVVNNEVRKKELSKIMAEGGFDISKPSVAKAAFEMLELDGKPPLPSRDQLAVTPRKVTVQEAAAAALVLLDHWYDNKGRASQDLISSLEIWWRRGCNPETALKHILQSLATEKEG